MALLFAADRQDHVEAEIEPNLMDSVNVICDRYVYSSIVYQSVSAENPAAVEWIASLNRHVQKPDLVFYLKVDPDEALRRRRHRSQQTEIYDDPKFQRRLAAAYDELAALFPDVNVTEVDANRAVEKIARECWDHVERLRSGGAPS